MRRNPPDSAPLPPKAPPLLLICWDDAHHSFEDPGETAAIECFEVGFAIEVTNGALRIGSQWSPEDNSYRFVTTIPLGMVKWWRVLGWGTRGPRAGVDKKPRFW